MSSVPSVDRPWSGRGSVMPPGATRTGGAPRVAWTSRLSRGRRRTAAGSLLASIPVGWAAAIPGLTLADLAALTLPFIFIAAVWPLIQKAEV